MMSVNLLTWRDSVINLLDKNNTTTSSYDISSGLVARVKSVKGGQPDYGISTTQLPKIWVRIGEYAEERNSLGDSSHRESSVAFDLYPMTQAGAGHDSGGRLKAEDEMIKLTQNILDLIRAKNDLSITGLWVTDVNTDFEIVTDAEKTYVHSSKITVNCKKLIS